MNSSRIDASATQASRVDAVTTRPFAYSTRTSRNAERDLLCDKVKLARLVQEYGTPLYVYSAMHIRQRVGLFTQAFSGLPTTLCYSVKANSNLSILRLLAGMGTGFDIVSGGELERVRHVAEPALRRVVFSGVGKTAAEIDAALAANILLFNVESAAELDLLEQRARQSGRVAPVALRVNPDVFAETHPYISTGLREHKFGVEMASASALYQRAARSEFLKPIGISVHIGSQIRTAEPFGQALRRVLELVQELRSGQGIEIQFIDAGGGVGISYELDQPGTFDPKAAVLAYAAEVRGALTGFDGQLLLEPGRFIVAQAGALIAQVLYKKQNGSKTFLVTDAAMNDLIRPALYQARHSILPLCERTGERAAVVDVVGPVCETGDFFARDRELPELNSGDCIALLDAGAYGMSLSSNYNSRPRAAEVLVDGAAHRLIRHRETILDLMATEKALL
ncbi:MAG TPA: diaminopimelate decarboxylase [Acidobacteriaceae bacterium]|nr:diaminopimelate decarboxylase [Acidobacteriaceae bacterium]